MKKVVAVSVSVALLLIATVTYLNYKAERARYPKGNFVFEENGYMFNTLPFGSTPDDLAAVLETPLDASLPLAYPFAHTRYKTTEPIGVLNALGTTEALFTEDGLCAFTFTAELNMRDADRLRRQLLDLYRPDFGEPAVENSPDTTQISLLWEDRKTGTALRFKISRAPWNFYALEVCAYEKWRYVEAGAEKWISE